MLSEMGFEREACERALIRFHNDLDKAMNFLLEGGIESQESGS